MRKISKKDLKSPAEFKRVFRDYIQIQREIINKKTKLDSTFDEIGDILLSACRANEFDMIQSRQKTLDFLTEEPPKRYLIPEKGREDLFLDESKVPIWIQEKLIPNILSIRLDDEDIVRLFLFSIEIVYQMFSGGSKATITQKGFRGRTRNFETIIVDQFAGKLGEIFVKKFLENNFPSVNIKLDWAISPDISRFRNDIINAKKMISIKTSPNLRGVWAEADRHYEYGIFVKCSMPQPTILQFFIEACGFSRVLDFADTKIPSGDNRFKGYVQGMRERISSFKCGEIQTNLKGLICGYFRTAEVRTYEIGTELSYLGKVREERHQLPVSALKYTKEDWAQFLRDVELM